MLGKRDSVYTYRNALAAACGLGGLELYGFRSPLVSFSFSSPPPSSPLLPQALLLEA